MRPRFSPILPRVRGCVSADKLGLPIRRRTLLVVVLQGLLVIRALIAEQLAERFQARAALDQPVPIVMAYLVAKMPQQRPVLLVLKLPLLLPPVVVRLSDIDCNEPIVVSCEDAPAIATGGIRQKLELNTGIVGRLLAGHRQAETQQGINEAPLGDFQ